MIKRKILLLTILLLNFTLYGQVELNFANSNSAPEREAVIRYLFDAFELYNPDIKVNILSYDENDSTLAILEGEGGRKPHLIMADSLLLSRLSAQTNLDGKVTGELIDLLGKDDFYTGTLETVKHGDNYIAIPYSAWLQVIWFRKDWFEAKQLDPPNTPAALEEGTRVFSRFEEGNYGLVTGSADDVYMRQCFVHIAQAMGLVIKRDRQGAYLDRVTFLKALELYKKLIAYVPPGENTWRYRDYYFQNKASLLIYSTHLMDDFVLPDVAENSLTNDNFSQLEGARFSSDLLRETGMITVLSGSQPASLGSVSAIALFVSDDPGIRDAQKSLVQFLYRSDVYITWLHMSPGGMLPVRPSLLDMDDFYRDPGGIFKTYGRETIQDMVSGLEFLHVLDPEQAGLTDNIQFQNVIYYSLTSDDPLSYLNSIPWIR
jgi:multiple sugar transport system substrate-binding protein